MQKAIECVNPGNTPGFLIVAGPNASLGSLDNNFHKSCMWEITCMFYCNILSCSLFYFPPLL